MSNVEPTVFAVGDASSAWAAHLRAILDGTQLRCISADLDDLGRSADQVDVCVVHVADVDALVTAAQVWQLAPHVSVLLSGADIDEPTRRAAYEAGVAFVTGEAPTGDELRAVLRMAHDQNCAGSPELVRAMCRAMCRLSSLAAQASDRTFVDAAVHEIAALFRADVVSVQLVDETRALKIVAQLGLADRIQKSTCAGGISEAVRQSGEPRIILRSAPAPTAGVAIPRSDLSASMCVPIASQEGGERVRGVVNIARRDGRSIFTARGSPHVIL